ncbi:MAG: DNA repair protein [Owenweeksia sp.]|nr:DNA repair protein [Owenweeksia sp.]MBF98750.1 DNA repair protein [Owenweeksia sp.]HBF21823.1 DNA repair protein [Cryomorphaceae bacterium]|tara:strand:- start:1716 stop:2324 length:609 start_codon:yes stop_codon:yes gene_type:complete
MNVRLTPEQKIKILNSDDLYLIMQNVLLRENKIGRGKEHLWVVCLNAENRILNIELVGLGSNISVSATPTSIYQLAVHKSAVSIIIVHNHPTGNLRPSDEDKKFTRHMMKVSQVLRVKLHDHIIISEEDYYSFADMGLMKELAHALPEEYLDGQVEKMEDDLAKLVEDRNRLEMARGFKKEGVDPRIISNVTGVSVSVIEGL